MSENPFDVLNSAVCILIMARPNGDSGWSESTIGHWPTMAEATAVTWHMFNNELHYEPCDRTYRFPV